MLSHRAGTGGSRGMYSRPHLRALVGNHREPDFVVVEADPRDGAEGRERRDDTCAPLAIHGDGRHGDSRLKVGEG